MNELENFISKLNKITESADFDLIQARQIIKELNEFLFANYDGIGQTADNIEYFSDFHKYWEKHHKEILNATIDSDACSKVADALHSIYLISKGKAFSHIYETNNLTAEEICRIRILTANQDFRGSVAFPN